MKNSTLSKVLGKQVRSSYIVIMNTWPYNFIRRIQFSRLTFFVEITILIEPNRQHYHLSAYDVNLSYCRYSYD